MEEKIAKSSGGISSSTTESSCEDLPTPRAQDPHPARPQAVSASTNSWAYRTIAGSVPWFMLPAPHCSTDNGLAMHCQNQKSFSISFINID